MKRDHYKILKFCWKKNIVRIEELSRKFPDLSNNEADLFSLAIFIESGFLGYTGPLAGDCYRQAEIIKASINGESIIGGDTFFYIKPKTLDYFQRKKELYLGYLAAAIFSMLGGISGLLIGYFLNAS